MAKLTITDAARVAGVARSTLYRAIQTDRVSADPDGRVDTAELLRVGYFGAADPLPPKISRFLRESHDEQGRRRVRAPRGRAWPQCRGPGRGAGENQDRPCPRIGNAKALLASPRRPKPKRALTTAPGPHSGRQAAQWL